jgi:hypothetical protein
MCEQPSGAYLALEPALRDPIGLVLLDLLEHLERLEPPRLLVLDQVDLACRTCAEHLDERYGSASTTDAVTDPAYHSDRITAPAVRIASGEPAVRVPLRRRGSTSICESHPVFSRRETRTRALHAESCALDRSR